MVPALILLNVDLSMLNVPWPIFMSSSKKWKQGGFYGKNESTNVAACWKTLLDGIYSWQAMQMLWWEEIDCNSGKRGYKCGNSDAGIRLPGVNWSPLKEYLIHDGFKDAVNPHCWEPKWTLHLKILRWTWADLKMVNGHIHRKLQGATSARDDQMVGGDQKCGLHILLQGRDWEVRTLAWG